MEDLEDVLEELPGRLVVGMGADSRMQPNPKTTATALHLTC